jgi:hypothetical protein
MWGNLLKPLQKERLMMANVIDELVTASKAAVVNLEYCIENHSQDANDKEVSEICIRELVSTIKAVKAVKARKEAEPDGKE